MKPSKREQLPDTPWHISYVKKEEGDPRRHKARCVYYNHWTQMCYFKESQYYLKRCGGSAQCDFYDEDSHSLGLTEEEKFGKQHSISTSANITLLDGYTNIYETGLRITDNKYQLYLYEGKVDDANFRKCRRRVYLYAFKENNRMIRITCELDAYRDILFMKKKDYEAHKDFLF